MSHGRHSKGRHLGGSHRSPRLRSLSSLLLAVLVAAALLIVAIPLVTKGEWRTVQTGSMEPEISAGDVVLLAPISGSPGVGDVIAFRDPLRHDRDVLHRVVAHEDDGSLLTKGDANDISDPWVVDPSAVIGARVLAIPKLGLVVEMVGSDLGIFFFLVVPALFILFSESKIWYRYIRYGAEALQSERTGRHLPPRGKHLAEAAS